jgi:hypothetical protein
MFRRIVGVIVCALLIVGCERDGGVIGSTKLPTIQGIFVLEDDRRKTPLTAVQHSIYYIVDTDRTLIFRGTGGTKPMLSLLGSDNVLIRYCGGGVEMAGSFLEKKPSTTSNSRLLRVQPVTVTGLSVQGKPIC